MDVVWTALVTSVIGTSVTYAAAEGLKWARARHAAGQFPVTFARSATNGLWVLVNESKREMQQVVAHSYGPGATEYQQLLTTAGITMPPAHTEYIFKTIDPGATVFIQWRVRKGKKEVAHFAEPVKVEADLTRYAPRLRLEPPPEWGG